MKQYFKNSVCRNVHYKNAVLSVKGTSIVLIILLMSTLVRAQITGRTTQGLSTLEGSTWPDKTCAVCWENASDANAAQRGWVQDAISATWEKESEFRFTGWGNCAANSRGIRIVIRDERPHTTGLGTELDGKENGMVLNFTFNNWTGCTDNVTNCVCRNSAEGTKGCIRKIAVHEFGHALGFAHEQNRTDAPFECQKDAQGADGDWWVTPYDANSIMNYCNPKWNNAGLLSEMDKYGVRFLYGGGGYITDPIIYGTNPANELLWYKHSGHWNGTFEWGANAGNKVGAGWGAKQVFSDGDGHVYIIQENGDLYWYNHIGFHDGTFRWSQNSRALVGKGWGAGYKAAFAGGGGVIYLIKDNGDLVWYKHLGYQDGSFSCP